MPFLTIPGNRLSYRVKDNGQAISLVLIHGAGMEAGFWGGVMRHVTRANCYAPDLPGHGASGGAPLGSVDSCARTIAAFVETLGLRRVILGGHSMGGAVALITALLRPRWLTALVLAGSGARLRVAPALFESLAKDLPGGVEMLLGAMYPPNTSAETLDAERRRYQRMDVDTLIGDYRACDTFDVMGRLNEIDVPTLVLSAQDDRLVPQKYAAFLGDRIAGAQLRVFPSGGHAFASTHPEEVAKAMDGFVGSLPESVNERSET